MVVEYASKKNEKIADFQLFSLKFDVQYWHNIWRSPITSPATLWELERILEIDVFRCSIHLMSKQVMQSLQSELRKRNALFMIITEVSANGNSRQVMQPPLESELQKWNAIWNGRQVTRLPPQSKLRQQNSICTFIMANRNGRQVTPLLCKVSCGCRMPYVFIPSNEMADRSPGLLRKVSCGSGSPYVC